MTDLRRASLVAALLTSAAVTVAACGGGTAASSSAEATASAAAESPTSTASEAPAPSEAPATSDAALPSFDLDGLTQNLANVQSYRIAISVAGSTVYQATVVSEPEKAEEITLGPDASSTKVIKIGDEAWLATGGSAYQKVDATMVNGLVGAFDPVLLLGMFANGNIGAVSTDLGTENKNGTNARHYRLDSTSSLAGAFGMPADTALDFWVADEGYLVGYEFSGAAADQNISINVTNVNDPTNKVERPT